jgi:hypothetical protein
METPDYKPIGEQLAPDYGPPPDWQSWPAYKPRSKPNRSRLKAIVGGLALAGLLVVGGAATVFAADPSPAPSTSPDVTTPGTPGTPSDGSNGGTTNPARPHGPCPNDGTGSGSGTDNGSTDSGTTGSNT